MLLFTFLVVCSFVHDLTNPAGHFFRPVRRGRVADGMGLILAFSFCYSYFMLLHPQAGGLSTSLLLWFGVFL